MRNDIWLCGEPSDLPHDMHTMFPASIMVLGVMSNEGHVMVPHFFRQGLRVNEVFIEVLEEVLKSWINNVHGERSYIYNRTLLLHLKT